MESRRDKIHELIEQFFQELQNKLSVILENEYPPRWPTTDNISEKEANVLIQPVNDDWDKIKNNLDVNTFKEFQKKYGNNPILMHRTAQPEHPEYQYTIYDDVHNDIDFDNIMEELISHVDNKFFVPLEVMDNIIKNKYNFLKVTSLIDKENRRPDYVPLPPNKEGESQRKVFSSDDLTKKIGSFLGGKTKRKRRKTHQKNTKKIQKKTKRIQKK